MAKWVVIVTDEPGWHGRSLISALESRQLRGRYISLADCQFYIGDPKQGVVLPNIDGRPVGVFVRGIPGGTLEQVIFRLNILHALKQDGVLVYNDPKAIERTVDKPLTSLLLARAGIPTPQTWICESTEQAQAILEREALVGNRLVQKPLFGSQGTGLHLADDKQGLQDKAQYAGVYYLQHFIQSTGTSQFDIRVFVIGHRAFWAMKRTGQSWISNRTQGGGCEAVQIDRQLAEIAEHASRVLDIDYAGVDVMIDRKGVLHVIEVNSIPAWQGLQKVVGVDIATHLIDAFINKMNDVN